MVEQSRPPGSGAPIVGYRKVASQTLPEPPRFLRLECLEVVTRYADGTESRPYPLDLLHRRGLDSVGITCYYLTPDRRIHIALLSAPRPGLYFRKDQDPAVPDPGPYLRVREAVAGSLEPGDRGEAGIARRVAAEVREEVGVSVDPQTVEPLGAGFFPSHGQSSEKIHLRAVRIDPEAPRATRLGDGSPAEEGLEVEFVEIRELLRRCRDGAVEDPKVEIGARRLAERLGYLPELDRWLDAP